MILLSPERMQPLRLTRALAVMAEVTKKMMEMKMKNKLKTIVILGKHTILQSRHQVQSFLYL